MHYLFLTDCTIIPPEIRDRLVSALCQYMCAKGAGSAKMAIADGYLAVDNLFSAIMLINNLDPEKDYNLRRHSLKIEKAFDLCSAEFNKAEISEGEVSSYHDLWGKVRYSDFTPTPNDAVTNLRITSKILDLTISIICMKYGLVEDDLETYVYKKALGDIWYNFSDQVSDIHEMWQARIEQYAEENDVSKLGMKIMNPSNFCDIIAFTDDQVTKNIIAHDERILEWKLGNFTILILN